MLQPQHRVRRVALGVAALAALSACNASVNWPVATTGPCAKDNGGCDPNAVCSVVAVDGGFSPTPFCACKESFVGDGKSCACNTGFVVLNGTCVFDACAADAGCSPNASCANAQSGAICTCAPGFAGNGIDCAPEAPDAGPDASVEPTDGGDAGITADAGDAGGADASDGGDAGPADAGDAGPADAGDAG